MAKLYRLNWSDPDLLQQKGRRVDKSGAQRSADNLAATAVFSLI